MSVGDQDHGRVVVAVAAVLAGAVHQSLDFLPGEIPAGSALRNCQVYSGWCRGLGCWKHRGNLPVLSSNWLTIACLLHSCKWLFPRLFYSASQLSGLELPVQAERIKAICARCVPAWAGANRPAQKTARPQCLALASANAGVRGAISIALYSSGRPRRRAGGRPRELLELRVVR